MPTAVLSEKKTKRPLRITRSISFETKMLEHIKKRARKERRSPNWVVNELIRREMAD